MNEKQFDKNVKAMNKLLDESYPGVYIRWEIYADGVRPFLTFPDGFDEAKIEDVIDYSTQLIVWYGGGNPNFDKSNTQKVVE
jgi:hypothetical protein